MELRTCIICIFVLIFSDYGTIAKPANLERSHNLRKTIVAFSSAAAVAHDSAAGIVAKSDRTWLESFPPTIGGDGSINDAHNGQRSNCYQPANCLDDAAKSGKGLYGLLPVFKPANITSADVCYKIKRVLQSGLDLPYQKVKVGHGGTLDPLATGVLVIGVGDATKWLSSYMKGTKRYLAKGVFGMEMDTQDASGKCLFQEPYKHVDIETLESAIRHFNGSYFQLPPMHSAIRVRGKRLYEYARDGKTVERVPRRVTIYHISLPNVNLPSFEIDVTCSGGTYIRTLISDIAKYCNTAGYLSQLVRTQQGPFSLTDCHSLKTLTFNGISEGLIKEI